MFYFRFDVVHVNSCKASHERLFELMILQLKSDSGSTKHGLTRLDSWTGLVIRLAF